MDTKDYLAKESYPLSTQTLDFIQNQILFTQKIGALLGEGAWLLKEATAEKRGLVFVNQNGVCELVALVVGSGFKYYWIERTIENETTTEVLMGANSYTPGPNQTLISSDGLKRPEDLWDADISEVSITGWNCTARKNNKTKLVTLNGNIGVFQRQTPFQLPEGYRPKQELRGNFVKLDYDVDLDKDVAFPLRWIIKTNGEVSVENFDSISSDGGTFVNISYYTN